MMLTHEDYQYIILRFFGTLIRFSLLEKGIGDMDMAYYPRGTMAYYIKVPGGTRHFVTKYVPEYEIKPEYRKDGTEWRATVTGAIV
jgi:hypothetical protein